MIIRDGVFSYIYMPNKGLRENDYHLRGCEIFIVGSKYGTIVLGDEDSWVWPSDMHPDVANIWNERLKSWCIGQYTKKPTIK